MLGEEGIRRKAAPDFQLNLVAYDYRALLQSMLQSTATEHATITVLRTLQRNISQTAFLQSVLHATEHCYRACHYYCATDTPARLLSECIATERAT